MQILFFLIYLNKIREFYFYELKLCRKLLNLNLGLYLALFI